MSATQSQELIYQTLRRVFGELAKKEWNVRLGATDVFINRLIYAPRVDIAVGPFNQTPESEHNTSIIRQASQHPLIQDIIDLIKKQNGGYFNANHNPRCLLAIEIEFSGSSKHTQARSTLNIWRSVRLWPRMGGEE